MGSSNFIGIIAPPILGLIAAAATYRLMMTTVLVPVFLVFAAFIAYIGILRLRTRSSLSSAS